MRFFCRILYNGLSFRHRRSHHDVDGRSYRHHIQIDMGADQLLRLCNDNPMFNQDFRPQRRKSLDVLINRPEADITASRQNHLRMLAFPKQCPQKIIRRANPLDIIVFYGMIRRIPRIDDDGMPVRFLNPDTDRLHRLHEHPGISNIRYIFNGDRFVRHGSRRQKSKRSVFGSTDFHLANQRYPAFDHIFFNHFLICIHPASQSESLPIAPV